jgi:type II secretory ATPase GspE/PulE/Tfp pilus assembly ATPase PilB-like protein
VVRSADAAGEAQAAGDAAALDALLHAALARGARSLSVEPAAGCARVRLGIAGRQLELDPCAGATAAAWLRACRQRCGGAPGPREGGAFEGEFAWRGLEPPGGRWIVAVQALPLGGGRVALRLRLHSQDAPWRGLAELGLEPEDQALVARCLGQPQGLVLVLGPDGGGRSASLRALLAALDLGQARALALDADPHPAPPQTLALRLPTTPRAAERVLARALRWEPDTLLLDGPVTSSMVAALLQAAARGRRILLAGPGERASDALAWLGGLGATRADLASALNLVLAQRLVPRLCAACSVGDEDPPARAALARAANSWLDGQPLQPARAGASACAECGGRGERGRVLLYEALTFDAGVRAMVEEGVPATELALRCLAEGRGLWDQGLRRLARGQIALAALCANLREPD